MQVRLELACVGAFAVLFVALPAVACFMGCLEKSYGTVGTPACRCTALIVQVCDLSKEHKCKLLSHGCPSSLPVSKPLE